MSAVQDKSAAATKADDAGAAKASVSASAASAAAASKPQSEHQAQWDASGVAISEEDIGIVAYANGVPGFSAVLKQRYSDFIVNEVGGVRGDDRSIELGRLRQCAHTQSI